MTYLKKPVGIRGQFKVEINFISVFTQNYVHPCSTPLVKNVPFLILLCLRPSG